MLKKILLFCGVLAGTASLIGCASTAGTHAVPVTMEEFRVISEPGIEIYVRNKRPAGIQKFSSDKTLIYVHGATYPAETAFDLPLNGVSWMG